MASAGWWLTLLLLAPAALAQQDNSGEDGSKYNLSVSAAKLGLNFENGCSLYFHTSRFLVSVKNFHKYSLLVKASMFVLHQGGGGRNFGDCPAF